MDEGNKRIMTKSERVEGKGNEVGGRAETILRYYGNEMEYSEMKGEKTIQRFIKKYEKKIEHASGEPDKIIQKAGKS